jgi:type IV secretion system protein VirB10
MTNAHASEQQIAADLRLHAARPPVARLSRKVLIILGATSSVAIVAAVGFAMTSHPRRSKAAELYSVGGTPPERLNSLPKDYGSAPKLGPPLPGDLGGPILASSTVPPAIGQRTVAPGAPPDQVQAAQEHLAQEREAARTSRLFAIDGQLASGITPANAAASGDAGEAGAAAGAHRTVLDGPVDRRTTSPDRLSALASPFLVQAGAMIPAALLTGIRSDLPGQVVAQVTENVFDTVTGRYLLIPQGTRLIGTYDSQVAFGQSRVLLAWTRLILPNGRSLVLEKLPAGDSQGYAGLQDRVDRHWGSLFGAATLSTVLGIGAELGQNHHEDDIVRALRYGTTGTLNQVGQQAVGRALDVPPTLTIRPGAPVRVMVTRDLVLEPYKE